jgi:hypothetical protein
MGLTPDQLRTAYYRLQDVELELQLLHRRLGQHDRALASLIDGASDAVSDARYEARDLLWERREPSLEPLGAFQPQSLKAV